SPPRPRPWSRSPARSSCPSATRPDGRARGVEMRFTRPMDDLTGLTRLVVGGAAPSLDSPSSRARGLGREATDLLAQVPLFSTLSRRHLGRIAGAATTKRFAAGAPLVRVGKPADAFYV